MKTKKEKINLLNKEYQKEIESLKINKKTKKREICGHERYMNLYLLNHKKYTSIFEEEKEK